MSQSQPNINKAPRKRSLVELLRRTEQYELWKRAVFIRDRFTCQQCGKRNGRVRVIEAHHLTEFSDLVKKAGISSVDEGTASPVLWDVDNGQTLCHECHKKTPSYPKGLATVATIKKNMNGLYKRKPTNKADQNG